MHRPDRTSTVLALASIAALCASLARPTPPPPTCPAGYAWAELHAYGQSYEAGFGPSQTPVVVVQHEDRGVTPTTYVPFLACTRALTSAERAAANAGLSVPPSNWPAR